MISWFAKDEVVLAFGLTIALPKLGEALNSVLTPFLYNKNKSVFLPFFIGLM
jgi:hypothetical protein